MHFSRTISLLSPLAATMLLWLVPALPAQERPRDDPTPLTESQRIVHVLSRFAFGPTPKAVAAVRKKGLDVWFEEQLSGQIQESA